MVDFDKQRAIAKNRVRRRGIYILPNLFTTAALFAGFYAIVQAMNQRFDMAAIAIFIAAVLDSPYLRRIEAFQPGFLGHRLLEFGERLV